MNVPWTIQPYEDGFFITEREGHIAFIDKDGSLNRQQVELEEEVASQGEGGLLGFVLDENFKENQTAYVYHTYRNNNSLFNRIAVIKKQGDNWREQKPLLENIPGADIHNGGRLKLGPDGMLYATTGDANMKNEAQQSEILAGSILRIDLNGRVPEDNPLEDSYVFSYGHRNPQGLAWDENERLYSSEHGPSGHDEINRIEAGQNYGWLAITGDATNTAMQSPLFHSGNNTWAPSGISFHNGNLYVTGLRGNQLMRFNLEKEEMEIVFSGEGRLRDVYIENDNMYVITNNRDGRGTPGEQDDRLLHLKNFEVHTE
nr:PQQ-dependent sugar dehydrogenase [Alteribacillus bidgolensis]